MTWLIGVVLHPAYLFIAGAALGLAVGMWVDTALRRRDLAKPLPPGEWRVPYEAAFAFGDKEKIAKFYEVENRVSETAEKCRALDHEEQGLSGDSFFNPENREKNFKRIGKLANEQARAREANKSAADFRDALERDLESDVLAELKEGRLVAKGFLSPHIAGKPAMVIPADEWRFLTLDFDDDKAVGPNFEYIALVVGKPTN